MLASAVFNATDPCEYGSRIRGANVDVLVNRGRDFRAKVTRIDLHTLWMQRGEENLARIFRSTASPERVIVSFLAEESSPAVVLGGAEITSRQLHVLSPGQLSPWRSLGACHWGAMSLPIEDFVSWAHALTGREIAPPTSELILTPPASPLRRLQELHRAAMHLAERSPATIAAPEAARQLEHSLIEAMFACMPVGGVQESVTARHHRKLMSQFEAVLEANPDRSLSMPEICAEVGAPGRTLRACCAELLGMSPKRYLDVRRMHLARQALLLATPETDSVTEIGTRYGFWELGRFATGYRSLFGESPSVTLKRPFIGSSRRE
jgi:AraC-like DNA-binding protein